MEELSLTPRDQHDRSLKIFADSAHFLYERRDRLTVTAHDLLHQRIPDHKICRAGILIDEKEARSHRKGFDDIGCLRRAAARILRVEGFRILPVRKVVYEHGNVRPPDAPPILRPDLYSCRVRDHELPAVTPDMVIHAHLERFQKRGFSMISASDNECDPLPDPHPRDALPVRKLHRNFEGLRGNERHRSPHRSCRHAALSRQDRSVRHKGSKSSLRECVPDRFLTVRKLHAV